MSNLLFTVENELFHHKLTVIIGDHNYCVENSIVENNEDFCDCENQGSYYNNQIFIEYKNLEQVLEMVVHETYHAVIEMLKIRNLKASEELIAYSLGYYSKNIIKRILEWQK